MRFPVVSKDAVVQGIYLAARRNLSKAAKSKGETPDEKADHRFAEMLAFQSPPRANTDREFFDGMGTLADQFGKDVDGLNSAVAGARSHGYEPNPHDVYLPTIAQFEGDPLAFVPATGGRGHIKKVCEMRGVSCRGAVTVEGRQPESDPLGTPYLADDLVIEEVAKAAKTDPNITKASKNELRQEMTNKFAPKG